MRGQIYIDTAKGDKQWLNMFWKSSMSTGDPKFLHSERRTKIKIVIDGQMDFFSMLPFSHSNDKHAIAILDAQMGKWYDIVRLLNDHGVLLSI